MQPILYSMVFIAGAGLTLQVGLNAALRSAFGNAGLATLVNFMVGTIGVLVLLIVSRTSFPGRTALAAVPVWAWFGGLLGAYYVSTATIAGPRIGAATLLALAVLGQLTASLLVDHYGLLGFPRDPVSPTRIGGAALLFAGVWLIARR